MSIERISGIMLLLGSVIFLIAAFVPASWVFAERDPQKKIEMINTAPGAWRFAQFLFGLGATIAAIALLFVYIHLKDNGAGNEGLAAFILAMTGVIFWDWHVFLRANDPQAFAFGQLEPNWTYAPYAILTNAALVLLGLALFTAKYPRWLGWTSIISGIFFTLCLIIFHDIPPFTFYLILGMAAVVMIL